MSLLFGWLVGRLVGWSGCQSVGCSVGQTVQIHTKRQFCSVDFAAHRLQIFFTKLTAPDGQPSVP